MVSRDGHTELAGSTLNPAAPNADSSAELSWTNQDANLGGFTASIMFQGPMTRPGKPCRQPNLNKGIFLPPMAIGPRFVAHWP